MDLLVCEDAPWGEMRMILKRILLRIWKLLPNSLGLRRLLVWLVSQKFLVGIVGIVLNEDNEILLLEHSYRKEYPWGLPGGWLTKGEQPTSALKREIREETGYGIDIVRPVEQYADQSYARLDLIYLCRIRGGTFTSSDEIISAAFYPEDDLPLLIPHQISLIHAALEQINF